MAYQPIIFTTPADTLPAGADKINDNFVELYAANTVVNGRGSDIASASTVSFTGAATQGSIHDITGTTAITAVTLADGREAKGRFTGALVLTNGASLILPTGANITTAVGDVATFRGYAAGIVRVVGYQKVDGTALAGSGGGAVATDAIFDVKGDLPVGTGANTAARLATGTNGQVLTANSATATGLEWAAGAAGSVATDAIFDTKGDLPVGTGANTAVKLVAGTNGFVLSANSATATGLEWIAAAAAGDFATEWLSFSVGASSVVKVLAGGTAAGRAGVSAAHTIATTVPSSSSGTRIALTIPSGVILQHATVHLTDADAGARTFIEVTFAIPTGTTLATAPRPTASRLDPTSSPAYSMASQSSSVGISGSTYHIETGNHAASGARAMTVSL